MFLMLYTYKVISLSDA